MLSYRLKWNSKLIAATESAYRRRWGWWLCDDQWNGTAEESTWSKQAEAVLKQEMGNVVEIENVTDDEAQGIEMAIRILGWR